MPAVTQERGAELLGAWETLRRFWIMGSLCSFETGRSSEADGESVQNYQKKSDNVLGSSSNSVPDLEMKRGHNWPRSLVATKSQNARNSFPMNVYKAIRTSTL